MPTTRGERRVVARVLFAGLVLVGCRGDGGSSDDRNEPLFLEVDSGEVRVLGDYEPEGVIRLSAVAVGPDGTVYVRVNDDHVDRALAHNDLFPCCGVSDSEGGGIDVAGDTIYIVHGGSFEPAPERGVGAYIETEILVALDLPRERGQVPGDVAVGADGSMYLSILRAEPGSVDGVEVLRATGSGGFEVVAGAGVGCTEATVPVAEARFTRLAGIAVADDGTAYVADAFCGKVFAIADGQVSVAFGRPGDPGAGTRSPVDVAVVGDEVYVADAGTGEVVRAGDGAVVLSADDVPDGFHPEELVSLDETPDGDLVVAAGTRLIGVGLEDGPDG